MAAWTFLLMVLLSGSLLTYQRPLSTGEWERCGVEAEIPNGEDESGLERRKSR